MTNEQGGPADLLLPEPRRADGCGPTDLDDLHATATATGAAIIRAKSAIRGCLIGEHGSPAITVRNDDGLA